MSTVVSYTKAAIDTLIAAAKARGNHTGTQTAATISDLTEVSQDLVAAMIVAGTNVTKTYDDTAGTLTLAATLTAATEGVFLSTYTAGTGTATANTTAIQNAVNAAKTANKPLINDLGAISVSINGRIDMIGDGFKARFNGMQFTQTVNTAAGVRFGGQNQDIDGLTVYFSANPASTDTAANAFEWANSLLSKYSNLRGLNTARGLYMLQSAPAIGSSTTNTVFSCVFMNIEINGWAISAMDFKSWPSGGASSTGNAWINIYFHNNFLGSPIVCSDAVVIMRDWDESSFVQFNVEWCKPSGDAMFMQQCRNLLFHSIHFEGITLSGQASLMRSYYDFRLTIQTLTSMATVIANDTGQKSIFRAYTHDGNPGSIDATSIRVRNTTNSGTKPFGLLEIESGSAGCDIEIRKADEGDFVGGTYLDSSAVVPSQLKSYNDVLVRSFAAPNIPVDKFRTTNKATITSSTTLVSDDVMTFAAAVGTYIVEGIILYTFPAAADYKLRFNVSGTATGKFATIAVNTAATTSAAAQSGQFAAVPINTDTVIGGVDSVELGIHFRGEVIVTAAGTFTIQYAQSVSTATASSPANIGSHISYRKIS